MARAPTYMYMYNFQVTDKKLALILDGNMIMQL